VTLAVTLAVVGCPLTTTAATAAVPGPITITVGAKGSWTNVDDTPAFPFIDKDGTFYYEQAHSLYGPNDGREWTFFTGTDFDAATRSGPISDTGTNPDTTALCNNSPTGIESTSAPSGSSYSQRNFCVLAGVWVDPDTGDWYGLVHNEFTPQPFGDGIHYDGIDYAVSTDQGRNWTIRSHVLTSPYSTKRGDAAAFPQQTYHYGVGDPRLYVDAASGYFYAFYGSRIVDKFGGWKTFYGHVARAPISGKMAPGSWRKWYNGSWSQPGVGGRESTMVEATAANPNGYVPVAKEYNPATPGTVDQQVAAGTTPPTSPLFVMDITYNAYLGLYIGEPQAVDQSGNAPQQYYATDNLATQKWTLIGDSGSYRTASWYRWFLDSTGKTSSAIVGRTFRTYCSFGCSNGSSGEYVNLTMEASTPAPFRFDPSLAYRVSAGGGRVLAQIPGGTATTSLPGPNGSGSDAWIFNANGDGSYRITNAASRQLLGVPGVRTGRAWGAAPTVTPAGTVGPAVGQQWFIVPGTTASNGAVTGTYRLVNRYSGLVLGVSATTGRLAETTAVRAWTDTSGSGVGGGRTAAEQTLTVTPVGPVSDSLNGARTVSISGKALDNPAHSTTPGTQLITYAANGGANQIWDFTQHSDGSYQLENRESGLCADVEGGALTAGARIIQWTCTGNVNQRWRVVLGPDGGYQITSARGGLFLTAGSLADGAPVTQQANTGSARQRWTIS
jgi:hypothetical protein